MVIFAPIEFDERSTLKEKRTVGKRLNELLHP